MNSFGIREAEAAGVFAKTPDQKQTVLAVVNMFGIPNVVATQINKRVIKTASIINKKINKCCALEKKLAKNRSEMLTGEGELVSLGSVSTDWSAEGVASV